MSAGRPEPLRVAGALGYTRGGFPHVLGPADPHPRRRRHHMAQSRRDFLKTAAAAGTLSGSIGFPMVSRAQAKTVVVWWNRGYYKEEDEAMIKIAQDFEKAKGVTVDISFTI